MSIKMKKVKLGDVLSVKRGASLSGDYYATEGDKIRLTLGNFNYPSGGFKNNTSKENIYFTGNVRDEFVLKKGDIITPLTEQVAGLLGETARIPEDDLYIQSGDIGLVTPKLGKLDPNFAYYLLPSPSIKYQLGAAAQQTKIRHTSPDKIEDCIAWIPEDIEDQKKIGVFLDMLNSKITNNNSIITELEAMAKEIYDYWFVQFDFPDENGKPYKSSGGKMVLNEELGREIPEGWEIARISDFCNIFTGHKDVNAALESGPYKFYSCAPGYKYSNEKIFEGDAILVSGNGSYTGRTIFVSGAIDLYQRTYCITGNLLEYIYFEMQTWFIARVHGGTHGSAIPYIVYDDIAKETFVYNENVIKDFISLAKPILKKILTLQNENQELISLRDYLLPLLMNGQVTISDQEGA